MSLSRSARYKSSRFGQAQRTYVPAAGNPMVEKHSYLPVQIPISPGSTYGRSKRETVSLERAGSEGQHRYVLVDSERRGFHGVPAPKGSRTRRKARFYIPSHAFAWEALQYNNMSANYQCRRAIAQTSSFLQNKPNCLSSRSDRTCPNPALSWLSVNRCHVLLPSPGHW